MDQLRGMKTPRLVREGLAEMMGTLILCVLGIGSIAQFVLAKQEFGGYWAVSWGWGLGVAYGIYWSGGVSGGHINPAVTLALAVCGRFKWSKLPLYWISQLVGAILGSGIVFAAYQDYMVEFVGHDGQYTKGNNETLGIWSSYPPDFISNMNGFSDQVLATAMFVGTIFAILDHKNIGVGANIAPFLIGLFVLTAGATFGINAGFGLNPARDLGPRIFISMVGWGSVPFSNHGHWWIYSILGQLLGGVIGGVVYEFTIAIHHEIDEELSTEASRDEATNLLENGLTSPKAVR
ncbi:aquaporin-9 [Hydra vulgaris]|uniref:aquaporin-9 n=1 Tax=Hydra vulgaris TaxID=6087 RepID=UPI00019275F6|nr:aquaporin-9 [Hydra vulgaris]